MTVRLERHTDVNQRRVRRPLTENDVASLLEVTVKGPDIHRLSGADRVVLYILASDTSYRRNQVGAVRPVSFDFVSSSNRLAVAAGHSKRRRIDSVRLR